MVIKGVCPVCEFAVPVLDEHLDEHRPGGVRCDGSGAPSSAPVRAWVEREVTNARLVLANAPLRRALLAAAIERAGADLATHDAGVSLAERTMRELGPLLPPRAPSTAPAGDGP